MKITWNKGLDFNMKDLNNCYEGKTCDKCKDLYDCKRGTPLEDKEIKSA